VTRRAIGVFVLIDNREVGDVTFLRGQAGLLGDTPKGIVGLECGRALCQDPVQNRSKLQAFWTPSRIFAKASGAVTVSCTLKPIACVAD
jgi:hypothetical protein